MNGSKMTRIIAPTPLPRAWQIFTHTTMDMIRLTTGIKNKMIVQTGNWAT